MTFDAQFMLYVSMAHYVGKVLHIRPSEILDTWGCAELLVAYGEYSNESSKEAYEIWKSGDKKGERPDKYHVEFYTFEDLQE